VVLSRVPSYGNLYKLCEGIIEYFREAKSDILKVCTQMDLFDDLRYWFCFSRLSSLERYLVA